MTWRFVALIATSGLLGALTIPASAQYADAGVVDVIAGTVTPVTPADPGVVMPTPGGTGAFTPVPGDDTGVVSVTPGGTTSSPGGTGTGVISLPPAHPAAPLGPQAGVIVPKATVRTIVAEGRHREAEPFYHTWASYWREEDADLLVAIEQNILLDEYRAGTLESLVALATAGDGKARELLLAEIIAGSASADAGRIALMADAIRIVGESGDRSLVNPLLLAARQPNDEIAIAAIEALAMLGDTRIVADLMTGFDTADLARSVTLARTVGKLGGAKLVGIRFRPQLRFPDPAARAKAAMVLGAVGDQASWPILYQLLIKHEAPYYPLALVALGGMPTAESQAFVAAALLTTEPEQLAALKSADIIPEDKLVAMLTRQILGDIRQPDSVRCAAIRLLVQKRALSSAKVVRALAFGQEETESPAVRAAAMTALPALGVLASSKERDAVRLRLGSLDDTLVRASRAALLGYGLAKQAKPVQ